MTSCTVMAGVSRQALRVHSTDYQRSSDCRMPHEFTCTELVHFTENEHAENIGLLGFDEPFCFKAKQCLMFDLIWWSSLPPANCYEVMEKNLELPADEFHDCGGFGESQVFSGPSLCGPLGFVTSWVDMLKQYAISRQSALHQIEYRVLGTFLYRKEIMYAVLVCIKGSVCYKIILQILSH